MAQLDWVAREVQPWLDAAAQLQAWSREAGTPPPAEAAELQQLLLGLARRQIAVMPEAHERLDDAMRERRRSLLRLGAWRVLHKLHALQAQRLAPQPPQPHGEPMAALLLAMADPQLRVPPGVGPELAYALGPKAAEFFDAGLRQAWSEVAGGHAAYQPWLARLDELGCTTHTAAGAQAWSEAWTACIAANLLSCLSAKSGGQPAEAMKLIWRRQAIRLHQLDRLELLPARSRHLRMDLWTGLVQAQVLQHRSERFATPARWHRVELSMRNLGVRETTEEGAPAKLDQGLGVDLLHLPVFTDRASLALRRLTQAPPAEVVPQTPAVELDLHIDLPGLDAVQQANYRLVLHLRAPGQAGPAQDAAAGSANDDGPGAAPTVRRAAAPGAPAVDPLVVAHYTQWREARHRQASRGATQPLTATELQWQPPARGDDDARDLGSAALWRAAASAFGASGHTPQWLDVAMLARTAGGWQVLELDTYARVVAGELHFGLALASPAPGATAAALRQALAAAGRAQWAATRAGLGAFVLAAVDLEAPGQARGG